MEEEIYNSCGEYVTVCYYPGANLTNIARRIRNYTRSHTVRVAYILVGVNDITVRDPNTGECFTLFESPDKLRDHLMDLYMDLLRYCYITCGIRHVVIPTMTGISLSRYN